MMLGYNKHYEESARGWHCEIQSGDGQVLEFMGNRYVSKYDPAVGALDDVREEGLQKFNYLPCRRSN
jgi:hypothetical protein